MEVRSNKVTGTMMVQQSSEPCDVGPHEAGLRDAGLCNSGQRDAGLCDAGQHYSGQFDAELRGKKEPSAQMIDLPDEILLQIFNLIEHRDRINLLYVSPRFQNVLRDPMFWKDITIRKRCKSSWSLEMEKHAVNAIKNATALQSLVFSNVSIIDASKFFDAVSANCPLIERLCVPHQRISNTSVVDRLVEKCPNLSELELNVRSPGDYMPIADLPNLRVFRIRGSPSYWGFGVPAEQDHVLKHIVSICSLLEEVHIDSMGMAEGTLLWLLALMNTKITGLTVKLVFLTETCSRAIAFCRSLTHLTLRLQKGFATSSLHLGGLKSLTYLKIESPTGSVDRFIEMFRNPSLENLRVLKIKKLVSGNGNLLREIAKCCQKLEEISIDSWQFIKDPDLIAFFENCPTLKIFKISNQDSYVTGKCFINITRKCPLLQMVKVKSCSHIHEKHLAEIARQKSCVVVMHR